ncbi:MAG: hypothetical protein H7329_08990 [Opitutaceae bacterium]|nr:hypothetical protein [Cytophagales bacterium]
MLWLPKKQFFLLFFSITLSFQSFGQRPVLTFLSDSILVGEPTKVIFYFKHDSSEEIVFPDSNSNYAPFEFINKQFFTTRTLNGISTDSVVYTLALYEVEGTHSLSLPVTLYLNKDTLKISSEKDSVSIIPLITQVSDTLKLKSNTYHIPLENDFNYLIVLISIAALILIVVLAYLFFGKQILRQVKKYRDKIAHGLFVSSYTSLISNLNTPQKMEEAVSLWKKYIERIENKPFTTYTSTEIALNLKNENLKKNLQNIDGAIYGGRSSSVAQVDFSILLEVANDLYKKHLVS